MSTMRERVMKRDRSEVAELLAERKRAPAGEPGAALTHDLLESEFLRDPLHDRKGFFEHLAVQNLMMTLARCGLLRAVTLVAEPETTTPLLPDPKDGAAVARFAFAQLWRPMLKEVGRTQLQRVLEECADRFVAHGDPVETGRWVRDPRKAAAAASLAARDAAPSDAGILDALRARAAVALHTTAYVLPRPSLVMNLAALLVDELDVGCELLYRSYTRHRLTALAKDETASGQARHFARVQQDALDSAHPPYEEAGKFALTTRNSVVRTALAVLFEVLAGGVGTLLWPGWGTLGFSTLGGVTVQLFM